MNSSFGKTSLVNPNDPTNTLKEKLKICWSGYVEEQMFHIISPKLFKDQRNQKYDNIIFFYNYMHIITPINLNDVNKIFYIYTVFPLYTGFSLGIFHGESQNS